VARTLYGLRHFALVFHGGTGNAAGQQFALFVDQTEQKIGIFIVNVFDTQFLESAVFGVADLDGWGRQVANFALVALFLIYVNVGAHEIAN
jgi:hypothetical protein